MKLIMHTKPIMGDDEKPKGWHLDGPGSDYTLCGLDTESGEPMEKEEGRVTCPDCREIIKICRKKDIKI